MSSIGTAIEIAVALTSKSARSTMVRAIRSETHFSIASCPCCGYEGKFESTGAPIRIGAMCPKCKSLERHRLFVLVHGRGDVRFGAQDVLHFAPEKMNGDLIKVDTPKSYKSADIQSAARRKGLCGEKAIGPGSRNSGCGGAILIAPPSSDYDWSSSSSVI